MVRQLLRGVRITVAGMEGGAGLRAGGAAELEFADGIVVSCGQDEVRGVVRGWSVRGRALGAHCRRFKGGRGRGVC